MPPRPVDNWPDEPVTETAVRAALDSDDTFDHSFPIDETVFGIWGITGEGARGTVVGEGGPSDAVVDIVFETPVDYRMYSYTHHDGTTQWIAYDTEEKGTEGGDRIESTLSGYDLLAGESDLE